MSIRIEILSHGESDLWLKLCPFAVSNEVLKEFSGPIISEPGTRWIFAIQEEAVLGFTSLAFRKGYAWRDYAYVIKSHRKQGVFSLLSNHWEILAQGHPLRMLIREVRWNHYEARGFNKITQRCSWCVIGKEAS